MTRAQRITTALHLSSMSARTAFRLIAGMLGLATTLGATARWVHNTANAYPTKAEVESVFVRRDTFALYRLDQAAQRREDSTARAAEYRDLFHAVMSMDSSDKCRRNLMRYCR